MLKQIGTAITLAAVALVPVGCMSSTVTLPNRAVTTGNPMPTLAVSPLAGGTITVDFGQGLRTGNGFRTMTAAAMNASDVAAYEIRLVQDQGASSDYSAAPAVGSPYTMPGQAAPSIGGPAADANLLMQFNNVPNGTYRAVVRAFRDTDAAWATTGDRVCINKNSAYNTNGAVPMAVSSNTAVITVGAPTTPTLTVTVDLVDEKRDPANVQLTVNSGFAAPAVTASDI